jgi:DNA modification methylase
MELPFRLGLVDAGLALRQQLVWVKDTFVFGRQDYHWRHESILYGWKDGASHFFGGGRTQDTVWEIPRPKKSEAHPTMKPVELVARAIGYSSKPEQLVLEPFSGSGTTVLACEQTGRKCYAIELDPRYVDVAVKRWEGFTGQKAQRIPTTPAPAADPAGTGMTWVD